MIILQPRSRAAMMEAQRRATPGTAEREEKTAARSLPHNIETVLDLGNVTFFHFRGRAYGVPPLPWRIGQRLLRPYLEAKERGASLTASTQHDYVRSLHQIAHICWRHCYPASRPLRWLRRLGLMRNPFYQATEEDLIGIANFFLARRMRSGGSMLRPLPAQPHRKEIA